MSGRQQHLLDIAVVWKISRIQQNFLCLMSLGVNIDVPTILVHHWRKIMFVTSLAIGAFLLRQ